VSGNNGFFDHWVVKTNSTGQLMWQHAYGGVNLDLGGPILELSNGDFIIGGTTMSNDGDISTGNQGLFDIWIIHINSSGSLINSNTYGGSLNDAMSDILLASNGNFIVSGGTESSDGDVSQNNGGSDAWFFEIDNSLNMIWEKNYGGSTAEASAAIIEINAGEYVFAGVSDSNDGDVSANNGSNDYWVVALADPICEKPNNIVAANITDHSVRLEWDSVPGAYAYQVQYRQTGVGGPPTHRVAYSNFKHLNNLNSGVTYQYRVRAGCTGLGFSKPKNGSFTTLANRMGATEPSLEIFPNPVSELLTLQITGNIEMDGELTIFDLYGKIVRSETISNSKLEMNISNLPGGLYLLQLRSGEKEWNTKFEVLR
jgi:hypothetical protein